MNKKIASVQGQFIVMKGTICLWDQVRYVVKGEDESSCLRSICLWGR